MREREVARDSRHDRSFNFQSSSSLRRRSAGCDSHSGRLIPVHFPDARAIHSQADRGSGRSRFPERDWTDDGHSYSAVISSDRLLR
jgi:hypothetical protein